MLMQLTQIKFGGNLEQMHKQLKQERIVLEKSAKLNLDPGRCDGVTGRVTEYKYKRSSRTNKVIWPVFSPF